MDVSGRLAVGMVLAHAAVEGIFAGIEEAREEQMDAVQSLTAELARVHRIAAAAQDEAASARAETARARQDLRSCAGALFHERARADRAEAAVRQVVDAVRAQRIAA